MHGGALPEQGSRPREGQRRPLARVLRMEHAGDLEEASGHDGERARGGKLIAMAGNGESVHGEEQGEGETMRRLTQNTTASSRRTGKGCRWRISGEEQGGRGGGG